MKNYIITNTSYDSFIIIDKFINKTTTFELIVQSICFYGSY